HLQSAAEALDLLYQQNGLQHLELNPSRILLPTSATAESRRVLLGDFGLAQLLWVPAKVPFGQAQMRYTAPELAQHLITRSCDQYSLAIVYMEMLTGHHPFRGRRATAGSSKLARLSPKDLARAAAGGSIAGKAGANGGPNLQALPAHDRDVLARALDP